VQGKGSNTQQGIVEAPPRARLQSTPGSKPHARMHCLLATHLQGKGFNARGRGKDVPLELVYATEPIWPPIPIPSGGAGLQRAGGWARGLVGARVWRAWGCARTWLERGLACLEQTACLFFVCLCE